MIIDQLRDTVTRYAAGVTARDRDGIVALFTADAVMTDPVGSPPHVGRDAIRAVFADIFDTTTSGEFSILRAYQAGNRVAIEFSVTFRTRTDATTTTGVEVFAFDDQGLIQALDAYWNQSNVTVTTLRR